MNPAPSFGPAIVGGDVHQLWISFVGPALGAILATIIVHFIRGDMLTRENAPS